MALLTGKQQQPPSHAKKAKLHYSLLETARQTSRMAYVLWKNFSKKRKVKKNFGQLETC